MNNICDRHFRIRSTIKNKVFLKLGVLCLLFFLLCSCNKNDGNVNDDIEVVNKGDNISEEQQLLLNGISLTKDII